MLILAMFSLLFCIAYCSENRLKINITPYGEIFYRDLLTEIKFKIWRFTFLKSFLPLKNYGMDFGFPAIMEI